MIRKLLLPVLLTGLLGGCVTDYAYRSDGGGYYYGQPSVDYRYYGGYYGGYGYGPYGYYPYTDYYRYPYYGYWGYYGYDYPYDYYRRHRHWNRDPRPPVVVTPPPNTEPRDGHSRDDYRLPLVRPPLPGVGTRQQGIPAPVQRPVVRETPRFEPRPRTETPRFEPRRTEPRAEPREPARRSESRRRGAEIGTSER